MRIRSFVLTLLAACLCLFGPMAAADPVPDGPGYVLPMDISDAPASFDTDTVSTTYLFALGDPGGSSGLPELVALYDFSQFRADVPRYSQRSSHIEPGITVMLTGTIDHVPRLA